MMRQSFPSIKAVPEWLGKRVRKHPLLIGGSILTLGVAAYFALPVIAAVTAGSIAVAITAALVGGFFIGSSSGWLVDKWLSKRRVNLQSPVRRPLQKARAVAYNPRHKNPNDPVNKNLKVFKQWTLDILEHEFEKSSNQIEKMNIQNKINELARAPCSLSLIDATAGEYKQHDHELFQKAKEENQPVLIKQAPKHYFFIGWVPEGGWKKVELKEARARGLGEAELLALGKLPFQNGVVHPNDPLFNSTSLDILESYHPGLTAVNTVSRFELWLKDALKFLSKKISTKMNQNWSRYKEKFVQQENISAKRAFLLCVSKSDSNKVRLGHSPHPESLPALSVFANKSKGLLLEITDFISPSISDFELKQLLLEYNIRDSTFTGFVVALAKNGNPVCLTYCLRNWNELSKKGWWTSSHLNVISLVDKSALRRKAILKALEEAAVRCYGERYEDDHFKCCAIILTVIKNENSTEFLSGAIHSLIKLALCGGLLNDILQPPSPTLFKWISNQFPEETLRYQENNKLTLEKLIVFYTSNYPGEQQELLAQHQLLLNQQQSSESKLECSYRNG